VRSAALSGGAAADNLIRGYFRQRRYAGSKDRREITANIYAILHDYEALRWRVEACGEALTARLLVIAWRAVSGGEPGDGFTGEGYGPAALDEAEKTFCAALGALSASPPEAARLNCPGALEPALRDRFGNEFAPVMEILNQRALATFRVNVLKMERQEAISKLGLEPAELTPTSHSPWGFTLAAAASNIRGHGLFKSGAIEVQNEASQIASLLVDARPGMQLLDLCAGAGGKSLALAACMKNKGQIYAADINARRLGRLKDRCRKAGARNIQIITLPEDDATGRQKALAPCLGTMDRVVVDAPCSGTGTWRHNPELRLRADSDWLASLQQTQRALLAEAAAYVKPGGRLVYMTCSLLAAENEGQIEAFLSNHPGWAIVPFAAAWQEAGGTGALANVAKLDGTLQLSPATGADGFYVAILGAPS
jgi:16S rRNA (cytosine967-C5)-methyltransferase